jgi:hypothetical protein
LVESSIKFNPHMNLFNQRITNEKYILFCSCT